MQTTQNLFFFNEFIVQFQLFFTLVIIYFFSFSIKIYISVYYMIQKQFRI